MNGDTSIVFMHRITKFYLHGGNVTFLKYFHQDFLGDTWDKCLKSRDTRNKKPNKVKESYIFFLKLRLRLNIRKNSTFYNPVETLIRAFLYASMLVNAGDLTHKLCNYFRTGRADNFSRMEQANVIIWMSSGTLI